MESLELAQYLGTSLGAAGAAAGAVWAALFRPLQKKLSDAEAAARAPDPEVAVLKQRVADLERRLEKAEERVAKCVTDDEFEAYTRSTTRSVQQLGEKLGSVTGAIEAWYRLQNKGT